MSSAALRDLPPNSSHRFRVKVTNEIGTSPWSSASAFYTTLSGAPNAPPPPTFTDSTQTTVEVSFAPPSEDFGSKIDFYELQFRPNRAIGENHIGWTTNGATNAQEKISAIAESAKKEIQVVTTVATGAGSSISGGSFFMSFNNEISDRISSSATSDEFKEALRAIPTIRDIKVRRFTPGSNMNSDVPIDGCYSWRVEFAVTDMTILENNHPTMILHQNSLSGVGSNNVQVNKVQDGSYDVYKTTLSEVSYPTEREMTIYETGGNDIIINQKTHHIHTNPAVF